MKNKRPLVSIIITTKNEEANIETCLASIKRQIYKKVEIIVVDNNSNDRTKIIAGKYTRFVYNQGPERSSQRNFGAKKAKGEYLLFIDADMVLEPAVLSGCLDAIEKDSTFQALVIPEKSFGQGFWAECKALERSFYLGNNELEAPRFFVKKTFLKIGGYDQNLISVEDWELRKRIEATGKIGRITSFILHNEGKLSLFQTVAKKFYYARKYRLYEHKVNNTHEKESTILHRYRLFFSNPYKLFYNPFLGFGMLFMKTCEFAAGAIGYFLPL